MKKAIFTLLAMFLITGCADKASVTQQFELTLDKRFHDNREYFYYQQALKQVPEIGLWREPGEAESGYRMFKKITSSLKNRQIDDHIKAKLLNEAVYIVPGLHQYNCSDNHSYNQIFETILASSLEENQIKKIMLNILWNLDNRSSDICCAVIIIPYIKSVEKLNISLGAKGELLGDEFLALFENFLQKRLRGYRMKIETVNQLTQSVINIGFDPQTKKEYFTKIFSILENYKSLGSSERRILLLKNDVAAAISGAGLPEMAYNHFKGFFDLVLQVQSYESPALNYPASDTVTNFTKTIDAVRDSKIEEEKKLSLLKLAKEKSSLLTLQKPDSEEKRDIGTCVNAIISAHLGALGIISGGFENGFETYMLAYDEAEKIDVQRKFSILSLSNQLELYKAWAYEQIDGSANKSVMKLMQKGQIDHAVKLANIIKDERSKEKTLKEIIFFMFERNEHKQALVLLPKHSDRMEIIDTILSSEKYPVTENIKKWLLQIAIETAKNETEQENRYSHIGKTLQMIKKVEKSDKMARELFALLIKEDKNSQKDMLLQNLSDYFMDQKDFGKALNTIEELSTEKLKNAPYSKLATMLAKDGQIEESIETIDRIRDTYDELTGYKSLIESILDKSALSRIGTLVHKKVLDIRSEELKKDAIVLVSEGLFNSVFDNDETAERFGLFVDIIQNMQNSEWQQKTITDLAQRLMGTSLNSETKDLFFRIITKDANRFDSSFNAMLTSQLDLMYKNQLLQKNGDVEPGQEMLEDKKPKKRYVNAKTKKLLTVLENALKAAETGDFKKAIELFKMASEDADAISIKAKEYVLTYLLKAAEL